MSTFDPAAFDRWLTTQPDDSIERGKLEDDLRSKISNMFDEVNVTLPEHVLDTAVTYAADLAEAYVTEVEVTCEKCGLPIDEDTSGRDKDDPTILTCANGYGCSNYLVPDDADDQDTLMPVPDAYVNVLVEGVRVLNAKNNKRIDKGKSPVLSVDEQFIVKDILDVATRLTGLYYEAR